MSNDRDPNAGTYDSNKYHKRTLTCSDCGYVKYEYVEHSIQIDEYTVQNADRHSCETNIDVHEFVENTHLTPMTYSRLKTHSDYIPTYRNCVAICFGLQIDLEMTEQLLKLAGYAFKSSPETAIFKIFWTIRHFKINDLNQSLILHGYKPLGAEQKK